MKLTFVSVFAMAVVFGTFSAGSMAVAQTHPDLAKQMLDRSQRGILERYQVYEDLASRDGSRFHPA